MKRIFTNTKKQWYLFKSLPLLIALLFPIFLFGKPTLPETPVKAKLFNDPTTLNKNTFLNFVNDGINFSGLTITKVEDPINPFDLDFAGVEFTNHANIIDNSLANHSTFTATAIISGAVTGTVKTKDPGFSYPANSFAGFNVDISSFSLNLGGTFNMKVNTYSGSTLQESKVVYQKGGLLTTNLLSNGLGILGFITTKTFDSIELEINVGGTVATYSGKIINPVIKIFEAGPELACNTKTDLIEGNGNFPLATSNENTGIFGVITLGSIANANGAITENQFATLNLTGVGAIAKLGVRNPMPDDNFAAETFAGFKIANSNLVGLNLLTGITIKTFDSNGDLVESSGTAGVDLLSLNPAILSGINAQSVGFITTAAYDEIVIEISGPVSVLGSTRVYNAISEKFCAGADLVCNETQIMQSGDGNYPLTVTNTTGGLLSVGGGLIDGDKIINNDLTDFAQLSLTAGVASEVGVSVKDQLSTYNSVAGEKTFIAFDLEDVNFLTAGVLSGYRLETYLSGTLVESFDLNNPLIGVGTTLLNNEQRKKIGAVASSEFDEVALIKTNLVGADLETIKVYGFELKKLCEETMVCDKTYYLNEPQFPVTVEATSGGLVCVGCQITGLSNVISANGDDYASIDFSIGVLTSQAISVKAPSSIYPSGSTAGFVLKPGVKSLLASLATADLLNALTISTYLNGTLQESMAGGNLLTLDVLSGLLTIGGSELNVGFKTTLDYNEIVLKIDKTIAAFIDLEVYSAFVDTRGAQGQGFDCCVLSFSGTLYKNAIANGNAYNGSNLPGIFYMSLVQENKILETIPVSITDGTYKFENQIEGNYTLVLNNLNTGSLEPIIPIGNDIVWDRDLTMDGKILFNATCGAIQFSHSNNKVAATANYTDLDIVLKDATQLPITLVNFSGTKTTKGNLLNWETTNEVNFDRFEIQKSYNISKEYNTINILRGGINNYEYLDKQVNSETSYYRLKMVDLDGTFEYSRIISVEGENLKEFTYPNPTFTNSFYLKNARSGKNFTLFNTAGTNIPLTIIKSQNEYEFRVPVSTPSGLYLFKYDMNDEKRINKIIIK